MILLGIGVGMAFGWKRMDCLFLGGMIAMSSTTIIYKAFEDMGLGKKKFAGLVLGILILGRYLGHCVDGNAFNHGAEKQFRRVEMFGSIGKLLFFLILWFIVGIYLIPQFLKRLQTHEPGNLADCFIGLVFWHGDASGAYRFSAAFGAFIMDLFWPKQWRLSLSLIW